MLYDDNKQTFTTLAIRGNVLHVLTRAMDGTVVDDATLYSQAHGWH